MSDSEPKNVTVTMLTSRDTDFTSRGDQSLFDMFLKNAAITFLNFDDVGRHSTTAFGNRTFSRVLENQDTELSTCACKITEAQAQNVLQALENDPNITELTFWRDSTAPIRALRHFSSATAVREMHENAARKCDLE
jgi:hypothetical protein